MTHLSPNALKGIYLHCYSINYITNLSFFFFLVFFASLLDVGPLLGTGGEHMIDFMVQFGMPQEKSGLVRIATHEFYCLLSISIYFCFLFFFIFYHHLIIDPILCLRMSTLRVVLSPHFWYELSDYFAAMPSVGKMPVDPSKAVEMLSDSYMGTMTLPPIYHGCRTLTLALPTYIINHLYHS